MVLGRISFSFLVFSYGLGDCFLESLRYTITVVVTEVSTFGGREQESRIMIAVNATKPLVRKRHRQSASMGELGDSRKYLVGEIN